MNYVSDVPYPVSRRLLVTEIYDRKGKPIPDVIKDHFLREGRLDNSAAIQILKDASDLLSSESTLLDVEAPVTGKITETSLCTFSFSTRDVTNSPKCRPILPSACILVLLYSHVLYISFN